MTAGALLLLWTFLSYSNSENKGYVILRVDKKLTEEITAHGTEVTRSILSDAFSFYKRVCLSGPPSVRRSVGPSVRRSVGPSVRPSVPCYFQTRTRRISCGLFGLVFLKERISLLFLFLHLEARSPAFSPLSLSFFFTLCFFFRSTS